MLGCKNGLLQLLNAEVAKFVGLAFFSVMLDADYAFRIGGVFDVGGDDSIDFNADLIAFATDAVGIPVVAFEGIAGALATGVLSPGAFTACAVTAGTPAGGPPRMMGARFGRAEITSPRSAAMKDAKSYVSGSCGFPAP